MDWCWRFNPIRGPSRGQHHQANCQVEFSVRGEKLDKSLSAVDLAARTISEYIASGRFVAGQRLPEGDLVEQLGVSKNVLREAFARLQQDGVLEVQRFRGAMVRRLSFDEVLRILTVNTLLLAWAMREAANVVANDPARREVLAKLRAGLQDLHPRNQREHLDAFYVVHDTVLELADNPYLTSLLQRGMNSLLREFIIASIPLGQEVVDHTKRLDQVLELVERGEGEAAFEALRAWARIERAWVNPLALQTATPGPPTGARSTRTGKER